MVPRQRPLSLDYRKGGPGGIAAVTHDTKSPPRRLAALGDSPPC